MNKKYRIILTGGGTGGHVYPNLAILAYLRERDLVAELLYIGIKGRVDEKIVPKKGIPFKTINAVPIVSASGPRLIINLFKLSIAVMQAFIMILKFRPHLIIAAGGYVSAPVIFAAALLKPFKSLRVIIHEQNYIPGLVNKVASLFADINFISYRESKFFIKSSKCKYSGYPVRKVAAEEKNVEELRAKLNIPGGKRVVLIIGGSLGARTINRVLAETMPEIKKLSREQNFIIIHSIGINSSPAYNAWETTLSELKKQFGEEIVVNDHVELKNDSGEVFYYGYQYIYDMPEYQQIAEIIVSRAGAGGLFEVMSLAKPALIVPKRDLPGNHQELNAISFAEKGACDVIFESQSDKKDFIDPEQFYAKLRELIVNETYRNSLRKGALNLTFPDTPKIFVDNINKLLIDKKSVKFDEDLVIPQLVKFQNQFDHLIDYLDNIYETEPDPEKNLYYQLYNSKIDNLLQSNNYLVRNKGVKLIGSCRRVDLYPLLIENFASSKGFVKRNTLMALQKAENYDDVFFRLIKLGIADPYYEVQREAIKLALRFIFEIKKEDLKSLNIYFNSYRKFRRLIFEVKVEAFKLLLYLFNEQTVFIYYKRSIRSSNVKVRQGVLDAMKYGYIHNLFSEEFNAEDILDNLLISSTDFKPLFAIRESYNELVKQIT